MENLIGLTLEEARSLLSAEQRDYRTVRIDGVGMMISCDFRLERVNLEVENNIVTRTYGG